jgi:hypothetical protein
MIVHDLINKIDKLQNHDKSIFEKYKNPLLGLITSRWYFSDSFRLFEDIDVNWENGGKIGRISDMAEKVQEFDISSPSDSSFEASVSSWYQPYHYTPRTKWGVHIRYGSWGRLSARFNKECPNLIGNALDSVKASFFYFYMHELFHHLIENEISTIEIKYEDPLLYSNYLSHSYIDLFNTSKCLEESLANSYLFNRSILCHSDKEYLKQELLSQGEGYNSFINYVDSKFSDGLQNLISHIARKYFDSKSNSKINNTSHLSEFFNFSYMHNVPIWIHQMPLRTYSNYQNSVK